MLKRFVVLLAVGLLLHASLGCVPIADVSPDPCPSRFDAMGLCREVRRCYPGPANDINDALREAMEPSIEMDRRNRERKLREPDAVPVE